MRQQLASSLLLGVLVAVGCSGEIQSGPVNLSLQHAADEFRVPLPLLKAVGYVETRFDPPVEGTIDRGFGVMKLVERDDVNQIAEAAALLGVAPEQVKSDVQTNIRGAAALLRHYVDQVTGRPEPTWDDWSAALQRLTAMIDPEMAAEEAQTVMQTMREGWSVELPSGEVVDLVPLDGVGSVDEALSRPYPTLRWVPAYSGNYSVGRAGSSIQYVVIHTVQGSYAGAISWFQNPSANVSAHYVVRSSDGQITQMVNEANTAWHVRNLNSKSIGIEHEGFVNQPKYYTDAMYNASAKLTCAIVAKHNIPVSRSRIIGHVEAPGNDHTDPGPHWNWTKYMQLVKDCIAAGGGTTPPPPPPPAGCSLGNGLYCGGNGVPGDARNLYQCTNGAITLASACVACERMPSGTADRCKATKCPYGDGVYCGGNTVGGNTSTLYRCTAGKLTVVSSCAKGCFRAPVGTADRCN
jgi:hypothetical protein